MRKKILNVIMLISGCVAVVCAALWASAVTTNTITRTSHYGRESAVKKLVFTVAPVIADDNSIYTTVTSDDFIAGELKRITLEATGTDTAFSIIVKDSDAVSLFSKTDCNSVATPYSYALVLADVSANKFCGVPVAGPLTLDVNSVDPNTLTGVTVTLYYSDP